MVDFLLYFFNQTFCSSPTQLKIFKVLKIKYLLKIDGTHKINL